MNKKQNIDPLLLRKTASAFATGITIITIDDKQDPLSAMTANSFLSVSLDPPLVLCSIQKTATILSKMIIGHKLGISILNEGQRALSDFYGGLTDHNPGVNFEHYNGCAIVPDNLAWYATRIEQLVEAGDHVLVICLGGSL